MTKDELIKYILESPHNTNPAILSQKIDEISGGGNGESADLKVTLWSGNTEAVTVTGELYDDYYYGTATLAELPETGIWDELDYNEDYKYSLFISDGTNIATMRLEYMTEDETYTYEIAVDYETNSIMVNTSGSTPTVTIPAMSLELYRVSEDVAETVLTYSAVFIDGGDAGF